jgi:hypothetical protein
MLQLVVQLGSLVLATITAISVAVVPGAESGGVAVKSPKFVLNPAPVVA